MEQSIPGDALVRTRTLLAAVLVGTMGLAAVQYAQSYFDFMMTLRATHPHLAAAGLRQLCQILAICDGLIGLSLASVLTVFSVQVFRSGQVPPVGMRVAFTVRIRTGNIATLIATSSLVVAAAVLVGSLVLGYQLWDPPKQHRSSMPGRCRRHKTGPAFPHLLTNEGLPRLL